MRRTLMAMVVTFGFAVVVQIVWSDFRPDPGDPALSVSKSFKNEDFPVAPVGSFGLDQFSITGSGELLGWSTCVTEGSEAVGAVARSQSRTRQKGCPAGSE